MKKLIVTLALIFTVAWLFAQQNFLPEVTLTNLQGENVSSNAVLDSKIPTWLVVLDISDRQSTEYIETLMEACNTIKDHKEIKIVAVYVGCHGSWTNLKPTIDGFGWDAESYVDVNNDFMRAFSINKTPLTMLIDKDRNLICKSNSNSMVSEDYLSSEILAFLDEPAYPETYIIHGR